jgi:hypothetical protein
MSYEELRDMPCAHHTVLLGALSTHSNINCHWVDKLEDDLDVGFKGNLRKLTEGKPE